jgi:inner membrane protein YidH
MRLAGGRIRVVQLDSNTKLAVERTRIAYDRTMMSWIRTATSLISFGYATFKFFELELKTGEHAGAHHLIGPREFAIVMVMLGLLSLVMGAIEYRYNMSGLRKMDPDLPRSMTGLFAWLLSGLGILTLVLVILRK